MKERVYVCHTYYHVYVSVLKELALPEEQHGQATMILSTMSTNFEKLPERLRKTGFFEEVILFEEKAETYFPELAELRKEQGNIVKNMDEKKQLLCMRIMLVFFIVISVVIIILITLGIVINVM